MIAVAAIVATTAVLTGAWLSWSVLGPSVIFIRNTGDRPVQLVITDASLSTQAWSGDLRPGGRRTVMIWFKGEGSPELRCRDQASKGMASLGYVTGYMPTNAKIRLAGCDRIQADILW